MGSTSKVSFSMNVHSSPQPATFEQLRQELAQAQQRIRELEQAVAAPVARTTGGPDETHMRLLARIPELNPNPVLRLNLAGEQVYANPAAQQLRSQLSETELGELHAQLESLARRSLQLRQPQQAEVRTNQLYLQAYIVSLEEQDCVNIYLADITARVQAEESLRASEARLREQQEFTQHVLDTSPNLIYVRDADARITFSNRAMRDLQQTLGNRDNRVAADPEGLEARERAHYARADAYVLATGEEVITEDPITLPTGEQRWFQSVKRPLRRPDGTMDILGVSTDITALKQAQHTLTQSEKKYRDLVYYAQALICTYDLSGVMLSVNPALAALIGRPTTELLGQPIASYLLADDREAFHSNLARMAVEGEAEGVLRIQPEGSKDLRYLLSRNFVVRQPGQAPYVVSHSHDITDRVRAEQEMKRARQEAEATARARENFLANMSHEIRTPMNGVLGMTAQLAKTRLDARQQELVRIIRTSGQHLLAVLNDVLEMAKITAGKLELEQLPFNLCQSMEAAVQPLALQAQEKGLEVIGVPLRDSCPVPWIIGDAHRLNQILINLVGNAVKFTSQGRITIKGEMLSETEDTLTVRFSVQDTGPGIAPEKQSYIFESFTQAYADTARQHGGTGLGLTISRGLVEQMGGQLTLESEVGKGSTFAFTLTLPKAPAEAVPAPTEETVDTGSLAGVRVLLVEDNHINRTVARMMLEPWGVVLEEATSGPAALALLEQHTYDVVLMDIQMPGMSGVEVTQRLRELSNLERAATPVIAVTANAFRADIERYLAGGFDDYLAKPFDEEELYNKIEVLLGRATTPAYDLTHLRELAQGRTVFVERFIRSFLTNIPTNVQELRTAAATENWHEVARVVHHIKPNLIALSVAGTDEPVAMLERVHHTAPEADQPSRDTLRQALDELLKAVEQALHELPSELPTVGA